MTAPGDTAVGKRRRRDVPKGEDVMTRKAMVWLLVLFILAGCAPRVKLFPDARDPLEEYTLEGDGDKKVLLLPIRGFMADAPDEGMIRSEPGMVQRIVSHLKKAREDEDIRAVVLKIDSPGGTVTASDMLYHEIMKYKEETGVKVVAAMTNLAASGGYYIALPSDRIIAHPTTLTGSVGVIFIRPIAEGFMDKIGYRVHIYKTGENKDMGSPFRPPSPEEEAMMNDLIGQLGDRFHDLVRTHRNMTDEAMETVRTARIFLAPDALRLGIVDQIGYLDDAVAAAREISRLPDNARLIVYRRTEYPEDNLYNTAATAYGGQASMWRRIAVASGLSAGFYYLWPATVLGE